jgi:photosystem II stability/assembly factor-like uncharacterized protein
MVTSVVSGISAQAVTPQVSGSKALIQAVSVVSPEVAWISGHNGAVLRTVDGGANWESRPVMNADSLQFRDVYALDANTAWLLSAGNGSASRIYRTTDGGTSWKLQFQNSDSTAFYDCFTFFDAQTGVAYSDAANRQTRILRTTNGGDRWELLSAGAVPAALEGEGAFAASGHCVTSFGSRHGWVALGGPGARLFRSTDAGTTWLSYETPFVRGESGGMTGVAFRDSLDGIGVAGQIGNMGRDTSTAAVGITTDGGRTWQLRNRPGRPGTPFGVVVMPEVDRLTAIAVGPGGLFVTRDNGGSWQTVDTQAFWSVGATGRRAWAVGPQGRVVRLDF